MTDFRAFGADLVALCDAKDATDAALASSQAALAAAQATATEDAAQIADLTAEVAALQAQLAQADPAYNATWGLPVRRDEFTGTLDTGLWAAASGAINTDTDGIRQAANVFTQGGNLILRASKRSAPITTNATPPSRGWDSAWVDMQHSQRYGRWEIRYQSLKPGVTRGIWPSSWLRADGAGGEADISESAGTPNGHPGFYTPDGAASSSTFYTQTGTGTSGVDKTAGIMWKHQPNPDGSFYGWHVAALEWTPDRMTVFADGVKVAQIDRTTPAGVSILDKGFPGTAHLRYTVHVGSDWIGHPDATTATTYDTAIDYVRVYPYNGQP